jgi:hypothetical protein
MADKKPKRDNFISKIVKDPTNPPKTILLKGYLGESSEEGHTRLYLDAQLSNYVEVPDDAILHEQDVPKEQSPLGETYVWIDQDAQVIHGAAGPQRQKSKFLEGPIAAAAAGAALGPIGPVSGIGPACQIIQTPFCTQGPPQCVMSPPFCNPNPQTPVCTPLPHCVATPLPFCHVTVDCQLQSALACPVTVACPVTPLCPPTPHLPCHTPLHGCPTPPALCPVTPACPTNPAHGCVHPSLLVPCHTLVEVGCQQIASVGCPVTPACPPQTPLHGCPTPPAFCPVTPACPPTPFHPCQSLICPPTPACPPTPHVPCHTPLLGCPTGPTVCCPPTPIVPCHTPLLGCPTGPTVCCPATPIVPCPTPLHGCPTPPAFCPVTELCPPTPRLPCHTPLQGCPTPPAFCPVTELCPSALDACPTRLGCPTSSPQFCPVATPVGHCGGGPGDPGTPVINPVGGIIKGGG